MRLLPTRLPFPRRAVVASLLAALVMSPWSAARAAEEPLFTRFDDTSTVQVDHAAWQIFLDRHLSRSDDGIAVLDYAAADAESDELLDDYVEALQAVTVSELAREEQMAFWINLYNAATVQAVLENLPLDSILEIEPRPEVQGPWDEPLLEVEGITLTLNDLEHRILRPGWRDPRVHYAVNCASFGCPDLSAEAFTAAHLERLLDQGAAAFVNHPRGVRFADDGTLVLSRIFEWFGEDFGADEKERLAHLAHHASPALRAKLEAFDGRIDYDYDWRLNQR